MSFVNISGHEMKEVTGIVERVGAYFGNGVSAGIIILLQGDNTSYIVLRHMGESDGFVGLTVPGDEVIIKVNSKDDDRKFVYHNHIQNLTLNARLNKNATAF